MLEMLNEIGQDFYSTPEWYRFGTLVKKKKVEKDAVDFKTNTPVKVLRSELAHCSASLIQETNAFNTRLVMSKAILKEEMAPVYDMFKPGEAAN